MDFRAQRRTRWRAVWVGVLLAAGINAFDPISRYLIHSSSFTHSQMPFALTTVQVQEPMTSTDTLEDPTFYLNYAAGGVSSSGAHAFLLRDGDENPADFEYVYDLGSPVGGQNRVLARGAQPDDRLCVFDQPRNQFGCEIIRSGDERLSLTKNFTWTPVTAPSACAWSATGRWKREARRKWPTWCRRTSSRPRTPTSSAPSASASTGRAPTGRR